MTEVAFRMASGTSHAQDRMKLGEGRISGAISIFLALLSLGGVLCFHFPDVLTTAELRKHYDPEILRYVLRATMFFSALFGVMTFFMSKGRKYGFAGILFTILAQLLGGATVEVGEFASTSVSFGLDWLVLDLLTSTTVFIFIEKLFPQNKGQSVFRAHWDHDLVYFAFNHLIISYVLLVVTKFSPALFGWAVNESVQSTVRSWPVVVQLFAAMFAADFMQYWLHRGMHEIPYFWRFHAIHHSPEEMDWLSGSRIHLMEMLTTRVFVFLPIFLLGFSETAINAYVIVVGFQAVFNHANVDIDFGILNKVFVTPIFHHWHHSADEEAIDLNYSAHLPLFDMIFGTYLGITDRWPKRYGVVGKTLPYGLVKQHLYPFVGPFDSAAEKDKKAG